MENACNKRTFASFRDAQTIINIAHKHSYSKGKRVNRKRKKIPVRSYKCESCGGWHLTSLSGK